MNSVLIYLSFNTTNLSIYLLVSINRSNTWARALEILRVNKHPPVNYWPLKEMACHKKIDGDIAVEYVVEATSQLQQRMRPSWQLRCFMDLKAL